jgi:PAS domain S-box-containing protein
MTALNELEVQINYRLLEDLKASDNRYRTFLNNLPDIVFSLDQQHCITYVNSAFETHLHYTQDDCLGKPLIQFISKEDQANFTATLDTHTTAINSSFKFISKTGSLRDMELHPSILETEGLTGLLIDVTERNQLATLSRESQKRLAKLIETTEDGIWDWNLHTNTVYYSDRWKAMLGYEAHEIGTALTEWSNRVHPDDLDVALKAHQDYFEGKTANYECLIRMQHKDGSWKWILTRGIMPDHDDKAPSCIIGIHTDVTPIKLAEEQLKKTEQDLITILNDHPDGIICINELQNVHFVNETYSKITGISHENVIHSSLHDLVSHLLNRYHDDGLLINALTSDQPSELLLKSKHHSKTLKLSISTSKNNNIQQVLYFRDISSEYEVDRMKSEFLATAAHELRTPMASIYGFSELLLNNEYDKAMTIDIVSTIHEQAKALTHMINDLLDLARIEARMGKNFIMKEQPIKAVIEQAIKACEGFAGSERIYFQHSNALPKLAFDTTKINQALCNIMSNACKYSPEHSPIDVTIKQRHLGKNLYIGIQIRDQGMGMTSEQSKHLFDRFWRADLSGLIAGTGLGMSIVKEIIDAHHGQIEVVSQPDQGTAITVWLPKITQDHVNIEPLHKPNKTILTNPNLHAHPTILINDIYDKLINNQFISTHQLTTLQAGLDESKQDAFQLFNAAVKNYDYSAALFLIENLK